MTTYEDLMILPYHHESMQEMCAMCGTNLKNVTNPYDWNEYHYCPKCKVVKYIKR